jgi:ribosomal protein S27AE
MGGHTGIGWDMEPIEADSDTGGGEAFTPSDNTTLAGVLTGLEETGFAANVTAAPGGRLRCGRCEVVSDAGEFAVASIRRLEGASEPDEMVSVVAAECPACGAGGAVVLGYGPMASADDAAVSSALAAPTRPDGG